MSSLAPHHEERKLILRQTNYFATMQTKKIPRETVAAANRRLTFTNND